MTAALTGADGMVYCQSAIIWKEYIMSQKNIPAQEKPENTEPATFTKKVGGTTYQVNVHFSKTSNESLTDKIIRLIKREVSSL